MSGNSPPSNRAAREICRRSEKIASRAPGYCTLTATSRPSCHTARCTWPIEAAAVGSSSKRRNSVRQRGPSSRASTWCTVAWSIGGAESCSRVRVSRYGPASSSGSAASKTDRAWPNFIAPPLRSPSTRNSCSAVRAWTSVSTVSAGRPTRPLAQSDRRASGQSQREAGQPGRARHRSTRQRAAGPVVLRVAHLSIVPRTGQLSRAHPQRGCSGQVCRTCSTRSSSKRRLAP